MKKVAIATVVLASMLSATTVLAQQKMGDMKDMNMDMKQMDMGKKSESAMQMTHHTVGVVRKIDLKAGTVNLDHEPVPSLKWPAMNMAYKVQSPDLLKNVAVGQKVQFTFIQKGSGYIITQLGK